VECRINNSWESGLCERSEKQQQQRQAIGPVRIPLSKVAGHGSKKDGKSVIVRWLLKSSIVVVAAHTKQTQAE
jgi:hypothetical protein